MTKVEQQKAILTHIEAMVDSWTNGDIMNSQKHYDYILGFCETTGFDFTKTVEGGLKVLKSNCVGVLDTFKYDCYLRAK